jgi:hypothetical protein
MSEAILIIQGANTSCCNRGLPVYEGSSFVSSRIITPYSGEPDVALLYQRFLQPQSERLSILASMYRFPPRYPHDEAITIIQGRASYLNRGPSVASGMRILHPSFDTLQHCLSQLEALTMERVPYGDVPFLETAESIRHELFLQQYPGPNAIDTPHQCLASPTLLHGESAKRS